MKNKAVDVLPTNTRALDDCMVGISCAQRVWVLNYLERYKHLTPLQALKGGGIMRLAARIGELRNQGHNIRTEMAVERGRRFARYWLE